MPFQYRKGAERRGNSPNTASRGERWRCPLAFVQGAGGEGEMFFSFAGYHAGDCTYNPSVTLALKLLMAPVPITLLLIAITLFCLHPINEERRKQMRTELEAMG